MNRYSAFVCSVFVISQMFFRSYIRQDINNIIAIIVAIPLITFLISALMLFITKKETQKVSKNWKTFRTYEAVITFFLIANLAFFTINRKLDNPIMPTEFAGYIFWLSLGLYLGFKLCKEAFRGVIKKNAQEQEMLRQS